MVDRWFSTTVDGSAMFRVIRKLKLLKPCIREFSKHKYSDIEARVSEAHASMFIAQERTLQNPSQLNAETEIVCQKKWSVLAEAEEVFFYQRSRVTWLDVGDHTTPYFHRMASSRQTINHIHFLEDSQGNQIQSQHLIEDHCVEYFTNLLTPKLTQTMFDQEDITTLLNFSCSEDHALSLLLLFPMR